MVKITLRADVATTLYTLALMAAKSETDRSCLSELMRLLPVLGAAAYAADYPEPSPQLLDLAGVEDDLRERHAIYLTDEVQARAWALIETRDAAGTWRRGHPGRAA